jgi:regulatory protein
LTSSDRTATATYVAGLKLLARRELSEAQVRQRLLRRGHAAEDVDTAIARLKSERALDDARVADALTRTEMAVRGRGRLRVGRQLAQAGIGSDIADRALDRAYSETDADALLTAALDKRLRGRTNIADQREMQRLYRYLVGQGFESDRVLNILRGRLSESQQRGHPND